MAPSMAGASIDKSMAEVENELSSVYGFVPQLFRAQSVHTLVIAAEARLLGAVLLSEGRLTRHQKEGLLCAVASVRGNEHCRVLHPQALSSEDEQSRALHNFALKLTSCDLWFSVRDIDCLTRAGFDDQAILETVSTIALGQMLCAMAVALEPSSDFEHPRPVALKIARPSPPNEWEPSSGPYLKSQLQAPLDFEPFSFLQDQLGFIPKLFRAQISHPDLIAAQVHFLERIVHSEELLSRIQKEEILLAISASNLNTYGVALQRQILDGLGVSFEESDAIVNDLGSSSISISDKVLFAEVCKLNSPSPAGALEFEVNVLESHGFARPQIVEAVAVAAFANFLNTLQVGLGVSPDFPPARIFTPKDLYPEARDARPTPDEPIRDPDAERVKQSPGRQRGCFRRTGTVSFGAGVRDGGRNCRKPRRRTGCNSGRIS